MQNSPLTRRGRKVRQAAAAPAAPSEAAPAASSTASAPVLGLEVDPLMAQEGEQRLKPEDVEDVLQLQIPRLSLGTIGTRVNLVSNHFGMTVDLKDKHAVWRCWRVDFARAETRQPKEGGLMKGLAPKAKGDDEREVSKVIRKKAVEQFMENLKVPTTDWQHDGNNTIYTRMSVTHLSDQRTEVEVPGSDGRRPFKAIMEVKSEEVDGKPREIDLTWLRKPPETFKEPSDAMVAMSEHRRFVQVAIRTLALEREHLIAQGRKVVCQDGRLVTDALALKFGREMWFGYIAQVEVVNGGLQPSGNLGPARTTLSLNLVASVGIPESSLIDLLGKLAMSVAGRREDREEAWWYARDLCSNYWDRDNYYQRIRNAIRTDLGLKQLKIMVQYGQIKMKNKKVYGLTEKPASAYYFDCKEMGGKVTVEEYFLHKHGLRLEYPHLPCVQVGTATNCVPMEYVYVMGGEHNLEVGKLRQDFQREVTRKTAMQPTQRRDWILKAHRNRELGPAAALEGKGIKVEMAMMPVVGRILPTPNLRDGKSDTVWVNYSNAFTAVSPPEYEVSWGLWCFSQSISESNIKLLAGEFKKKTRSKGMDFSDAKFVEWPNKTFNAYYQGLKQRLVDSKQLAEALREELNGLRQQHRDLKLLVVLVDEAAPITDQLYKLTKLITETELGSFVTQFINCKKGIWDAETKLNNIMLKVTPKVPLTLSTQRPSHNVKLAEPHWLLCKDQATMIMGADVCHGVAGISVAGVVGSTDPECFATYFHEIRGQSPFTLNAPKLQRRQSEERVVDLASMTTRILNQWRNLNKALPKNIIYYRDGVSDGQFVNVLRRERNLLNAAFKEVDAQYDPTLVIIVGQKRHQTRLWKSDKGGGKGKDDKGKGKGKDPAQVPPGTVASDGIAQPSHMNFFLVSQLGIQGTSVPCHYHVLHCDARLIQKGITVDDFERITFQLCHLYSKADKSVGYATPAYMADHACERGRTYLQAVYGAGDVQSTLGSSVSEEKKEENLRQQIEERTRWLNKVTQRSSHLPLNGLQLYC